MARYITIEREYGSGARYIAKALARACNIECYGEEILEAAAKDLHIPINQLEKYEESPSNSLFYSMMMVGKLGSDDKDKLMGAAKLFVAEQAVIRNFANKGPAIFLGHCANVALKDEEDVLKVFIKADLNDRKARIVDKYNIQVEEVDSFIKKCDKRRANYYAANTKLKWHDLNNYDLVINTSKINLDCAVELLKVLYLNHKS